MELSAPTAAQPLLWPVYADMQPLVLQPPNLSTWHEPPGRGARRVHGGSVEVVGRSADTPLFLAAPRLLDGMVFFLVHVLQD